MELSDPLAAAGGIGPSFINKLKRLNLLTVGDLINHYPFRYDDFSAITNVLEASVGQVATIKGEIWSIKNVYTRSRKILTKAVLNDGTSPIELTWFNSPWLTKSISTGDFLQVSGKVSKYGSKLSIVAPKWEKINPYEQNHSLHTGRIVPVYPETFGLTSKWLRQKIALVLPKVIEKVDDPIPIEKTKDLIPLKEAYQKIHFPENYQEAEKAKERLSFDELFFIQLQTLQKRLEWRKKRATIPLKVSQKDLDLFLMSLPFELTGAQKRVVSEIINDLKSNTPMNRLVQGEVGSGKTVVAAVIIYLAFLNGKKSLLMAPTEILAFQHFNTLSKLLEPHGVKLGIYTGSRKISRDADVLVGTHALLSEKLTAENVGLVIVDEQQRFGVEQRSLLRSKASLPHFLSMTATPIPRTVSLTLYGDLNISVIDEMPKGRQRVRTYYTPSFKRKDAYGFIAKKVREGDQIYIITPLIEESETLVSAKAAKVEYERLKKDVFPEFKLGLLHGKLKSKEKEAVINDFKDKKTDILVSTSVVEVGVDIPNATIMVIEGAERFGLAQIHQLRGRVGRGEKESFCLLFSEIPDQSVVNRLKNLERIYDGLKLAELDLKIRGSGDIFGVRQSGRWDLKIASLDDLRMIEQTREAAREILQGDPELDKHPKLRLKLREFAAVDIQPD